MTSSELEFAAICEDVQAQIALFESGQFKVVAVACTTVPKATALASMSPFCAQHCAVYVIYHPETFHS